MDLEEAQTTPLLKPKPKKSPAQRAVRKTFKGTAKLSNLLPTGSVLAFQILSPIVTRQGTCPTRASKTMTTSFLAISSLACFFLCFTDSFRDHRGKVRYGVATPSGLWVMDGGAAGDDGGEVRLTAEEAAKYRIRFVDFFHAVTSIVVFVGVAMLDQNVVMCFDPTPSEDDKDVLMALPLVIGLISSLLFLAFPSQRHGIGFPLSRN